MQQLRSKRPTALQLHHQGEYAKAEEILRESVEAGFEKPSVLMHLVRLCLLLARVSEAKELVEQAWLLKAHAPAFAISRMLWFQVLFTQLSKSHPGTWLGQLKTVLQDDAAYSEWAMQPVLDHLQTKLDAESHALLTALVAALNDVKNLSTLEIFPAWREAPLQPLE